MSLINDMLRNLETQRPDDLARQNLQREIRALPAAPASRLKPLRLALLVVLPAIGVGAAALHLNGQLLPSLGMADGGTAVVPPAAVAPVAAEPAAPVEPIAPAPLAAPDPVADELRLSPTLSALPTTAPPVLPVPDPLPSTTPKPEAKEGTQAAPAGASTAAVGPVKIEKSPVVASPRDRADAEFRRAEAALQAGRGAEAIDALRAALRHDAGYVPPRQMLLRLLLEQRRFEEAIAVLQEGLDGHPQQTGWAMSLARLQLERGDAAGADATLARSQSYAENSADYAAFQGHLKSRLGAPKLAVTHYQRATRLASGEGRWWLGLGLALEADGRAAEARDAFRRALVTGSLSGDLTAVAEQHLR